MSEGHPQASATTADTALFGRLLGDFFADPSYGRRLGDHLRLFDPEMATTVVRRAAAMAAEMPRRPVPPPSFLVPFFERCSLDRGEEPRLRIVRRSVLPR